MASRIKDRNKYGASLPKPPKCGAGKKAVWVEEKKDDTDDPRKKHDDKKPIHGKGKWVCKTKKDPKDPKPPRPKPRPNGPDGPNRPKPTPPKMRD